MRVRVSLGFAGASRTVDRWFHSTPYRVVLSAAKEFEGPSPQGEADASFLAAWEGPTQRFFQFFSSRPEKFDSSPGARMVRRPPRQEAISKDLLGERLRSCRGLGLGEG